MKLKELLENVLFENNIVIITDLNYKQIYTINQCFESDIEEIKNYLDYKVVEIFTEEDIIYIKLEFISLKIL